MGILHIAYCLSVIDKCNNIVNLRCHLWCNRFC